MAEHPIIFSGEMVKAILAGRKTMTRRVIDPQPDIKPFVGRLASEFGGGPWDRPEDHWVIYDWINTDSGPEGGDVHWSGRCPYGVPGDRLWVREKWRSPQKFLVGYDADAQCGAWMGDGGGGRIWMHHGYMIECDAYRDAQPPFRTFSVKQYGDKWRSPIHMPRWASRITLEITDVRVQRLTEITREDAISEGIDADGGDDEHRNRSTVENFSLSWDRINGKRPGCAWKDSPWVWAISFKRV